MKNSPEISFAEFEKEAARSEYQRSRMMMLAFGIGFAITVINYFLLTDEILLFYGGRFNYFVVICWLGFFIGYEYLVTRATIRYIRNKTRISNVFKIIHTLIEVSLVSGLTFYMVCIKYMTIYLDSPLNFLYYLFLILSVLHLNRRISVITGVAAGLQYAVIIWYSFHAANISNDATINNQENSYYIDCIVLIVSGGVAGFVSAQVKRRVEVFVEVKQEKQEMEYLFNQQVSQEVVHALVENQDNSMKHEATVLAMDIRNFTSFAEQHSPAEIMDFQNRIFGPILDIVRHHKGVVNQIMGDGLLATFGTSIFSGSDHADMAFNAALKIREKVRELIEQDIIPVTRIGLGIHTGEVVMGNIGNETRKQYSISGSAVIIAFRVEQLNKELDSELLITGEVKGRIVEAASQLSYMGLKSIKGFEYEVDVFKAA